VAANGCAQGKRLQQLVVATAVTLSVLAGAACDKKRPGQCNMGGKHYPNCPCLVDSHEKPDPECAKRYTGTENNKK